MTFFIKKKKTTQIIKQEIKNGYTHRYMHKSSTNKYLKKITLTKNGMLVTIKARLFLYTNINSYLHTQYMYYTVYYGSVSVNRSLHSETTFFFK